MRKIASGLSTLVQGIAELRNTSGTGHAHGNAKWVRISHARAVVGAASAWCQYMLDLLEEQA
jgi:hypothetical protein